MLAPLNPFLFPEWMAKKQVNKGPSSPPARITYSSLCQGRDHIAQSRQRLIDIFSFIQNCPLCSSFADLQREQERVRLCSSTKLQPCKAAPKDAPGGAKPGLAQPGPGEFHTNFLCPIFISIFIVFLVV